jgi:hypothetical protein
VTRNFTSFEKKIRARRRKVFAPTASIFRFSHAAAAADNILKYWRFERGWKEGRVRRIGLLKVASRFTAIYIISNICLHASALLL